MPNTTTDATAVAGGNGMITLVMLVVLIGVMYFLMIRPQRKKEKEVTLMRNGVKVGDDVITIGGICGKIVKTKDEVLTIQVGADKTKFEIMRWAVSKVVSESSNKQVKAEKAKSDDDNDEDTEQRSLPKRLKAKSTSEDADTAAEDAEDSKK